MYTHTTGAFTTSASAGKPYFQVCFANTITDLWTTSQPGCEVVHVVAWVDLDWVEVQAAREKQLERQQNRP